jgi:hypothetical protein
MLRTHALERFRPFVFDVGVTPAMLIYLNGDKNEVGAANENYARELMELFTMGPVDFEGRVNYSEQDVKELARALTGWTVNEYNGLSLFDSERHDWASVSVFGAAPETMEYRDVVETLFSKRSDAIAHFIAEKLYVLFVSNRPDSEVVSGLAENLLATDFSISSTVSLLLKSRHFFDESVRGVQIKSPVEFVMQLILACGRKPTNDECWPVERAIRLLNQELFNPPGVAGWPGHHDWISTNSITARWTYADSLLYGGGGLPRADLLDTAAVLVDPANPMAAFLLPLAMAEHFMAVGLENVPVPEIAESFGGDLDRFPVPAPILAAPPYVKNLAKIFLGGKPWYEWDLNARGANDRLLSFVQHLVRYPEYQLM